MNIKLVSIPVNDVVKAFKFYTEILNFYEHTYMPDHYLAVITSKKDKSGPAIILEPTAGDDKVQAYAQYIFDKKLPWILLDTPDVLTEYERLKRLGVECKGEPVKDEWGLSININDTCGNWIQLHQG